jgi:hypothetical protein
VEAELELVEDKRSLISEMREAMGRFSGVCTLAENYYRLMYDREVQTRVYPPTHSHVPTSSSMGYLDPPTSPPQSYHSSPPQWGK